MKQGAASANHLRFIEQYKSQEEISDILGISPRYQRLIKEGKRSGQKYADGIRALYNLLRKSEKPPPKRKRPPRKRPVVSYVYVPDMMNVLFQIFEPRTWKIPKRPYQHKGNLFFVHEPSWPTGEAFDTWDCFFIVFGVIPEDDPKFKKYKRIMVETETDDDDEEETEKEPMEADSIEQFLASIDDLSSRQKDLISHLPLEQWLTDIYIEGLREDSAVFVNFWISRVSTVPTYPQDAIRMMHEIARDSIDISNAQSDDVQYTLLGVYGFSGWNSKEGGD